MRLFTACLIAIALASALPADAQWRTPSGVVVSGLARSTPDVADIMRPERITWIDFSSGLLGALIGVLIAVAVCDDDPERSCPAGTPVIGGAIGAAIGVAVGRGARR
jgi:hypothetical protein